MTAKDLKNALLQEAVQGKLVPQIASEGNARDLVASIACLPSFASKTSKKQYSPIEEDEIPFDIPESWCWCRLGEITSILGDGIHGTPEYDISGEYYFVNGNNLSNGKIVLKPDTKKVNQIEYEKYKKQLNENTVFVSINGTLGNLAFYNNEKIILGKSACYFNLVKKEMKNFIFHFLQTKYFFDYAEAEATKTTIRNVSLGAMRNLLIPLPPLAEQKRIVEAIEKFMPLIEEYGKKEAVLKELNANIGTLTKKAILQEAVQGKLTEGWRNKMLSHAELDSASPEYNAKALLEQIKSEKAKLIKEGKIKKDKAKASASGRTLPEITEDEMPFDIPENWCWCRLGELSTLVTKGTTPRGGNVAYLDSGIGFLRAENVAGTKDLDLSNLKYIDEDTHNNFLKRSILEENDLLITIAGTLGRTAIVKKEDLPLNANQAVSIVRLVNPELVSLEYLIFAINAPELQKKLIGQTKVTAIPNLTLEIIENCEIPLPPLAEQKRIVEAIEKLLPLCEQLGI